ncbi:DNA polymerase III subunit beta [Rhodocytophaga rosea]|uniref:Beta sliding clamp n=1 Tax=Rhodocytophaga rosea TaxID=2704465 RepID=A0A6C0GQ76_9BACT|nr:DNA polymerase III subunit beta [Rhodocytophaga rosea]QHT70211.1 DNA polymerase III subunit beta [Rhodocytophaga rosea]
MKFVVSSSALLKQLSAISGVITTNPIVPILENFLFQINDGKLTITASDLQTSIIAEMPIDTRDNGSIAVPAKILLDTLKGLPEQPVTFSIDENTYGIELISDNGRYKLSGENATDFPRIPAVNRAYSLEFPSDVLGKAISNTIFATSADELRPAMTGVYVHLQDENATFVATDGHRLIRYRRDDAGTNTDLSVIIPRKALNLLKTSLPSEPTAVKTEFSSSNAFFSFNNIRMICRLIDERFPDYENAIPNNNPNKLTISRLELLSSLRRISIYANRATNQVRLRIGKNDLHISAEDLDFSNEANEHLACEYKGEDMEIGFNARFLIEMLNNLSSKTVTIELSAPNRAGLITPHDREDNEDILMLVMPVMLNNYA